MSSTKPLPKVKIFKWKGKNARQRNVTGEIIASDRIDAEMMLEGRKIDVKMVSEKSFNGLNPFSRIIKSKDITIFTRQLGMLITSDMGLVRSLEITADSIFNPKLKSITINIKNDVAAGTSFSDAIAKYPKYFDEVYVNMVVAGEQNGVLGETLISIAHHREKNEELGSAFKRAMVYPSFVVAFAVAVVVFMLAKIIPEFEQIYATYDENLPDYTQFVLNIAKFFQEHLFQFTVFVIIFILFILFLRKTSYYFNLFLSKVALKLPVLQHIFKKMAMVRFFQTTLITYSAGLSLDKAVYSSSKSMRNKVYQQIFEEVSEDVQRGEKLSDALKNSGYVPEATIQFIETGEDSGNLEESMGRAAKMYEDEMDDQFIMAARGIEPLIMIAVSFVIGAIVVAMYLPIFYFGAIIN